MDDTGRTHLDELLDSLADEVARRIAARPQVHRADLESLSVPPAQVFSSTPPVPLAEISEQAPELTAEPEPELAPDLEAATSSHAAFLMARLAIGVLVAIVLINIPLNAQGIALARSIPSSASLVIANGLVVKEASSPNIYVYRDDTFHWITSLEAFDHFGYLWEQVHIVEPGFMNQFHIGTPIYVLLKCDNSPNIYQLDAGHKRWIADIPTFTAQGYVWKDVQFVSCDYLHGLPDGETIPPGRGSPPPPLP